MNINKDKMAVHFSSETPEWATPQETFDELNKEFRFNLDPCATAENAKCEHYFTKEIDGLKQEWSVGTIAGTVFMNPPYGREIGEWVKKAHEEVKCGGAIKVVALLPARTDTKWFHDYCYGRDVRFLKGRLKFGGSKNSAPFPSMVVIFK